MIKQFIRADSYFTRFEVREHNVDRSASNMDPFLSNIFNQENRTTYEHRIDQDTELRQVV